MKTRTILFAAICMLTGLPLFGQDTNHAPPALPQTNPPSLHEQHLQQHLHHHHEAHRQAVETTNRHHEEAIRKHHEFELQPNHRHAMQTGLSSVYSQASYPLPRRFKHGDMYYASTFKGLNGFMSDIKSSTPSLHEMLLPAYNRLKVKRNAALATWAASTAIGGTLFVGGFTFLNSSDPIPQHGTTLHGNGPAKPNFVMVASGAGILLAGSIIGWLIQPREEDIYQFVNLHNKNSPEKKLEWEIGINIFPTYEPGIKLTFAL